MIIKDFTWDEIREIMYEGRGGRRNLIAIDTNIWFARLELTKSAVPWAIPWPCIHEFFGVVTNRRLWRDPTPPARALEQIDAWLDAPLFTPLSEGRNYREILRGVLKESGVSGSKVQDARVFAVCMEHGVTTLWSADRDFSRFAGLKVVNPLLK